MDFIATGLMALMFGLWLGTRFETTKAIGQKVIGTSLYWIVLLPFLPWLLVAAVLYVKYRPDLLEEEA